VWTFKKRGEDSQVRRTYACGDCGLEWVIWQIRSEGPPDCPVCAIQAESAITSPALLSNKARAVDIAEDTMRSFGLTDMNDNQRQGDIAYKAESAPTASEVDQQGQQAAELVRALSAEVGPQLSEAPQVPGGLSQKEMGTRFWGGGTVPATPQGQAMDALAGMARANAAATRAEGADPIALLHKDRPGIALDVVAADRPRRPAPPRRGAPR